LGNRKVINTCQALLHIKQKYSSSEFIIIKLRKNCEKGYTDKEGIIASII
jgi:hypothetical protein